MTLEKVIQELNEIVCEVLDNEDITLQPETRAADVEDWDSLSHIQIIVGAEKHFGVKFTAAEIQGFRDVGHMCEEILRKQAAK
jgi:acyl carrier protein